MTRYISMLRGINVGGRMVKMEKLKEIYESLGLKNILTYIQSGNVMFDSLKSASPEKVGEIIESKLKNELKFDVSVLIRTRREMESVIMRNPFASRDESKLHVTFLQEEPKEFPDERVKEVARDEEAFHFSQKEIYLYCPYGYGRTKLSNAFFEKRLGTIATTRNWRTVNALTSL